TIRNPTAASTTSSFQHGADCYCAAVVVASLYCSWRKTGKCQQRQRMELRSACRHVFLRQPVVCYCCGLVDAQGRGRENLCTDRKHFRGQRPLRHPTQSHRSSCRHALHSASFGRTADCHTSASLSSAFVFGLSATVANEPRSASRPRQ